MMNNFTTMQHFNTIYTAHAKIGNRKKKWRERKGGENQIPIQYLRSKFSVAVMMSSYAIVPS